MKPSFFLSHAAAVVIVTIFTGMIYVSVQQSHRSAANDPQLQLARDMAQRLKNNPSIDPSMMGDTIDISQSLAVFKAFYTPEGKPLQSNGQLGGQLPKIPLGVLDYTRTHGEDVLSWQPQRGVRVALVVESVQSGGIGFIAVGRSLKETEKRISSLTTMLLMGWLAFLAVLLIHFMITSFQNRDKQA